MSPQDEALFVYYSGHGYKSGLNLGREVLLLSQLKAWLSEVDIGMKVIILDMCRGVGGASKGWRLRPASKDFLRLAPRIEAPHKGMLIIYSSSPGQSSSESNELKGSIFTHYLITGLRGNADQDGDGQVTVDEMYQHAYRRTLLRTGRAPFMQEPYVEADFKGAGPFVMTRPEKATSSLLFPKGEAISYLVYRLPSGSVVAQVEGAKSRDVRLAVAPGRYLIQRRAPGKYGAQEVAMTFGGTHAISAWSFQPIPLQLLALKGGQLALYHHDTSVHYGVTLSHHVDVGHQIAMGYGYRLGPSKICGRFHLGQSMDTAAKTEDHYRWIGMDLFGQWSYALGRMMSSIGLGATLQHRWRSYENPDITQGLNAVNVRFMSIGPMVEGALALYLNGAWSLLLGATVSNHFYHGPEKIEFSLEGSLWMGVNIGL
jgi:hypothetical protein